jgi:hypothetical protein
VGAANFAIVLHYADATLKLARPVAPEKNLTQINMPREHWVKNVLMDWKSILSAPFDRDLELAVIDSEGPHALIFPCRRTLGGWINSETREQIDVRPTHWREWLLRSGR